MTETKKGILFETVYGVPMWIVLILVALFCIADLIRGMPKKKQQTVSPRKRILIAFTVMIVVVLLAVLILFCHFSRGA